MIRKKLNEEITPSEKMIVHKYYDERIEKNEKIIKLFSKIKFDDKEELFTYESSSKLSIPDQYRNLQYTYDLFDRGIKLVISSYRFVLRSFEKGNVRQLEEDLETLNKDVSNMERVNEMWKKNDKENRKKFFIKRKSKTDAKHMVNVCKNLETINKSLKYDRETYYKLFDNFDRLFPKKLQRCS